MEETLIREVVNVHSDQVSDISVDVGLYVLTGITSV